MPPEPPGIVSVYFSKGTNGAAGVKTKVSLDAACQVPDTAGDTVGVGPPLATGASKETVSCALGAMPEAPEVGVVDEIRNGVRWCFTDVVALPFPPPEPVPVEVESIPIGAASPQGDGEPEEPGVRRVSRQG
jgi:hypothetical protein